MLLFPLMGLLLQLLIQLHHLLVKRMKAILVLILFIGQGFIALPKTTDYPLLGDVHEIYTIKYSHIYAFIFTFMLFCD